jgi:hypothetical protein
MGSGVGRVADIHVDTERQARGVQRRFCAKPQAGILFFVPNRFCCQGIEREHQPVIDRQWDREDFSHQADHVVTGIAHVEPRQVDIPGGATVAESGEQDTALQNELVA